MLGRPAPRDAQVQRNGKQRVDGRDRQQLERLCRYVMRPPLSQERLEWRPDGSLELTLKNVWKDGTRSLVLQPFDLLVRLCSAIPPPWFNMVRYFGVRSSHSRHRARVVPKRTDSSRFATPAAAGDQLEMELGSAEGTATVRLSPDVRQCSAVAKEPALGRPLPLGSAKYSGAPRSCLINVRTAPADGADRAEPLFFTLWPPWPTPASVKKYRLKFLCALVKRLVGRVPLGRLPARQGEADVIGVSQLTTHAPGAQPVRYPRRLLGWR